MPPKKGGKKGKAPPDPDALSPTDLVARVAALEAEREEEARQRAYVQLERDRVTEFWEVAKRELAAAKAELLRRDRDAEDLEERHQVEIKVYKQKVKHLLYEHQANVASLKTDAEAALHAEHEEGEKRREEGAKDQRFYRRELRLRDAANERHVQDLEDRHVTFLTVQRQAFDDEAKKLRAAFEDRLRLAREDLELRRKQDVHDVEERKNDHIFELMEKHARAFAEVKNYYNDITHNNLDLIKVLKDDVAKMRATEAARDRKMAELRRENAQLRGPLEKAVKAVVELKHRLATHEKDRVTLRQTKSRLAAAEKQIKNVEWEAEVLQQRFAEVEAERDDLHGRFERGVHEAQRKAGLRSALLERKLEALSEHLEAKEAQLGEVLAASNLDPATLEGVNTRLSEVLDHKNRIIQALQYDVAKVCKAHNDLIRVYEAKLAEFGIPAEELGFRPLVTNTSTGPAGLVVGN